MKFFKYSATGNDFLLFDNRKGLLSALSSCAWQRICARRTGVGANGVIFVEDSQGYDFKMVYLNADGAQVSMCGNGARAVSKFCRTVLGMKEVLDFETQNGAYKSEVLDDECPRVLMSELYDQGKIDISSFGHKNAYYLNTGVPHCVFEAPGIASIDIDQLASPIRHDERFPEGVNVNFFEKTGKNRVDLRTFERGVEGETLSCGTGAVATAIFFNQLYGHHDSVEVSTPGGALTIDLNKDLSEIWLKGEVVSVYSGELQLDSF